MFVISIMFFTKSTKTHQVFQRWSSDFSFNTFGKMKQCFCSNLHETGLAKQKIITTEVIPCYAYHYLHIDTHETSTSTNEFHKDGNVMGA